MNYLFSRVKRRCSLSSQSYVFLGIIIGEYYKITIVVGHNAALSCAPNTNVAECLALILYHMFPTASNHIIRTSSRIDSNTMTLSKYHFSIMGFLKSEEIRCKNLYK